MASSEAVQQLENLLLSLREDDSFHRALEYPETKRAVDHWSGKQRLPTEQCEYFQTDPKVMMVLSRLRELNHLCKRAGCPVPLDSVMDRKVGCVLPDGRRLGGTSKEKAAEAAKETSELVRKAVAQAEASVAAKYRGKLRTLRCIAATGVAYRKTPTWEDRDFAEEGPFNGEIITFLDREDEWVRTEKGWLPLRRDGEPLFALAEEGEVDDDAGPRALGLSWQRQLLWQFGLFVVMLLAAKSGFFERYAMKHFDATAAATQAHMREAE